MLGTDSGAKSLTDTSLLLDLGLVVAVVEDLRRVGAGSVLRRSVLGFAVVEVVVLLRSGTGLFRSVGLSSASLRFDPSS